MAPLEAVIVPIVRGDDRAQLGAETLRRLERRAVGRRVKVDARDDKSPGYKFSDWEMRGVPLRIELGAKDLAANVATVVRRDREKGSEGAKVTVPLGELARRFESLLDAVQTGLLDAARAFLREHTFAAGERAEFLRLAKERAGMVEIPWCDRPECEAAVKAATAATTRNLRPLENAAACVACGEPAKVRAYFAQSY
jgi:prolyl-tRNA synthetase